MDPNNEKKRSKIQARISDQGRDEATKPIINEIVDQRAPAERTRGVPHTGRNLGSPLSYAHIGAFVEYTAGASVLKVNNGGKNRVIGGGKRGMIKGFSTNARRRLLYKIAEIKRDAELPFFVTLTYPDKFPEPIIAKINLKEFIRRFKRRFPTGGFIWKLEPQKRGAPHFHLLVWGCDQLWLMPFVPNTWYEIAGQGDEKHLSWHWGLCGNGNVHCVQKVKSFKGVWFYASKYLGKTFEVSGWTNKWTGRYWGVVAGENIPFGEKRKFPISKISAYRMIRYQKKFVNKGKIKVKHIRCRGNSLTIFCDANQWVDKLCPAYMENLQV